MVESMTQVPVGGTLNMPTGASMQGFQFPQKTGGAGGIHRMVS